ncbi:MAG: hypothetical protein ABJE10_11475 [bacterium]
MLVHRRDAMRPPRALVAVNDTTFVLNNTIQLTFEHGADGTVRLVQHLADGSTFVSPRIGDVPSDLAK